MRTDFSLRPASEQDLEVLVQLERKIQVAPWTLEHFREELQKPHSHIWVLTDDETDTILAGYLVFWVLFDAASVLNLGVDLGYRGLGFGKHMVQRAISFSAQQKARKVSLEVRKSNHSAIQLYQSLNFGVVRVLKDYYSNGEDAYHMELVLEGENITL